ncbi:MAG: DUF72 domain-containing protein [Chitinophagaceae bacterium]
MKKNGQAWIGTSNPVIPGNKDTFPGAYRSKSRLTYYGHLFNSVEINKSFYKIPLHKTYERWSAEVPADFRFSLKLSKEITHTKELKGELNIIDKFLHAAEGIGEKVGCILVQFPGKISLDYFNAVEQILRELTDHKLSEAWKIAVEFRNSTWYTGETWEMLDEFNAAIVLHDHPKAKMMEVKGHTDFVYIRFHGPKGDYRDSYTNEYLQKMATKIKRWLKEGKELYAYFNNTIGSAFDNAQTLNALIAMKN